MQKFYQKIWMKKNLNWLKIKDLWDLKNVYIDNEINEGKNIDLLITIPSLFKDDDGNEKKFQFLG